MSLENHVPTKVVSFSHLYLVFYFSTTGLWPKFPLSYQFQSWDATQILNPNLLYHKQNNLSGHWQHFLPDLFQAPAAK